MMSTLSFGYNNENRLNLWLNILNINNYSKAEFLNVTEEQLQHVNEIRVIEQDVLRTRANETFYNTKEMRFLMKRTLLKYCAYYSIQYMQGLNEILAPLLLLSRFNSLHDNINVDDKLLQSLDSDDPQYEDLNESDGIELEKTFGLSLAIFEKVVDRISPTVFKWAGVQALQAQLASLHMLLYYFEADLAKLLAKESMSTDIYAQSWFITIYARRLPCHLALYLWDILLQKNTPYFIVIIAVAFLQKHKPMLMKISTEILPQTLVKLNFQSEKEIDDVVQQALRLERSLPNSVIEDISRFAFDVTVMELERSSGLLDLMYRPCMIVDAKDVAIALMSNKKSKSNDQRTLTLTNNDEKSLRYLLIDCRSDQEQQHQLFIEGSLIIPPNITEEICNVIQQGKGNIIYDLHLEILSPPAAATLALLWSCRDDDLHLAIFGSGHPITNISSKSEVIDGAIDESSKKVQKSEKKIEKNIEKKIEKNKKSQKKNDLQLPSYKLATAMLIMGFSRVSIVKGFSDTTVVQINSNININTSTIIPASSPQISNDKIVESSESSADPHMDIIYKGLQSRTDGFASLAYHLCIINKAFIENGVIKIPQDILLAEKVRQFYLSKDLNKPSSAIVDRHVSNNANNNKRFNLPNVLTDINHSNLSTLVSLDKQLIDEKSNTSSPHGITALGNILKKLSGFRDEFIENVLIPPKSTIANISSPILQSNKPNSNTNTIITTYDKLLHHSKIQQIEISKVTLVEIQKTFAPISLVVDDLIVFERKFKFWTKELDTVMELSKRTVRSLSILTHVTKQKPNYTGLTDISTTSSTRSSISSYKRQDNVSEQTSDINDNYVMVSDNDDDTAVL